MFGWLWFGGTVQQISIFCKSTLFQSWRLFVFFVCLIAKSHCQTFYTVGQSVTKLPFLALSCWRSSFSITASSVLPSFLLCDICSQLIPILILIFLLGVFALVFCWKHLGFPVYSPLPIPHSCSSSSHILLIRVEAFQPVETCEMAVCIFLWAGFQRPAQPPVWRTRIFCQGLLRKVHFVVSLLSYSVIY